MDLDITSISGTRGLGLSIGWGLLAALDTLVSQAYGAGNQVNQWDEWDFGSVVYLWGMFGYPLEV